ncbi:hypothetical protein [Fontivita pretiosa]
MSTQHTTPHLAAAMTIWLGAELAAAGLLGSFYPGDWPFVDPRREQAGSR